MSGLFESFMDLLKSRDTDFRDAVACEKIVQSLKAFEEGANKLITWSLSIVGGSLLAIIDDSFFHPESRILKMGYFLFLFGWAFIAKVIFHGNKIIRINILLPLHRNKLEDLEDSFESCNSEYQSQLKYFNWALIIFGIWLIAYLAWWVFGAQIDPKLKT